MSLCIEPWDLVGNFTPLLRYGLIGLLEDVLSDCFASPPGPTSNPPALWSNLLV